MRGASAIRGTLARGALGLAAAAIVAFASVAGGAEPAPLDLNTASAQELAGLPGIGPAKAQAIIEHRAARPFASVDDLVQVKGIGERLLEQLRSKLTVGGAGARAPGAATAAPGAGAGATAASDKGGAAREGAATAASGASRATSPAGQRGGS